MTLAGNPMRTILALAMAVVLAPALTGAPGNGPTRTEHATTGRVFEPDNTAPVSVPEPSEKAIRFYRTGNVLWCIRVVWELSIPALILFTGFSARLRQWAEGTGRRWFFNLLLYIVAFMALKYLLEFPLNCFQGYFRQHAFDLSNQSFGRWLGNSLKRLGVDTAVCAAFLWIPYWLMRSSPRRWWLYTWMAATAATVFMVCLTPVWIDPLFNKFSPMKDKALESEITALAERAGIEGSRVFEVEKSADTKAVNAYMTGFMGTKRIVLWDTLIAKLDQREVLTVMGHEIGHYVLRHVLQGILLSAVLTFVGLYAFDRVIGCVIERFKARFGFDRLCDIASWPLVLLCFSLGNFALNPLILAFSRHLEHEADRFALELTRDNHADATASVKLQIQNLSVPRPGLMYTLWRASHPPVGERIDFANTYKPWLKGERLKYEHLFRAQAKVGTNEGLGH
jgi:Zn-dependent protease with chaperone function